MPRSFPVCMSCFSLRYLGHSTPPRWCSSRVVVRCWINSAPLTRPRRSLTTGYSRRYDLYQSRPSEDEPNPISTAESALTSRDGTEQSPQATELDDTEPQPSTSEDSRRTEIPGATFQPLFTPRDAIDLEKFTALKKLLLPQTPKNKRPLLYSMEIADLVPLCDANYVLTHFEFPTKATYSSGRQVFDGTPGSGKTAIKEICERARMPISSDVEVNTRDTLSPGILKMSRSSDKMSPFYWQCSVKTTIPGVFHGEATGECVTKSGAVLAAWLQILSAMHVGGTLRQLLPDVFGTGETTNAPPSKTSAEVSQLNDTAILQSGRDLKLEIYNYAAGLGLVPSFEIQAVSDFPKTGTSQASSRQYEARIRLDELDINATARAKDAIFAEIEAAILFKKIAEESQENHAPSVFADQELYGVLSNVTAKKFWQFYGEQDDQVDIEMEVEEGTGDFIEHKASLKVNGEVVGEPVLMRRKEDAKQVAYLVAAVHTCQSDHSLLADFKRTFGATHARKEPIPLEPIEVPMQYDHIKTMGEALVDVYDRGLPDQRPIPKVGQRIEGKGELHFRTRNRRTVPDEASNELFKRQSHFNKAPEFKEMRSKKNSLPVNGYRDEVINILKDSPYIIISAATGSGKTTQIPQIIFDDAVRKRRGHTCNIICTQPRRLAAESVARRVAEERGESLRQTVGYQVRFDSQLPRDEWGITYCTTGILLQKLRNNWTAVLESTTHIVIDEIHERDIENDFLMIVLKRAIRERRSRGMRAPKIILMSATLDRKIFSEYFGKTEPDGKITPCPTLDIPGRTFQVHEQYLGSIMEELFRIHGPAVQNVWKGDQQSMRFLEAETAFSAAHSRRIDWRREGGTTSAQIEGEESIPTPLIALTVAHIVSTTEDGAILVFLPGLRDILSVQKAMTTKSMLGLDFTDSAKFIFSLLHSSIPKENQAEVFRTLPTGCRRIILATNIAETSVTVPNVKYVVDSGLLNEKRYDPVTRISRLECIWESKSNMRQRRGRAGRVQDGNYYGVFSRERAEALNEVRLSELRRSDLSELCLAVKAHGFEGTVEAFLAEAIEPPAKDAIDAAMRTLTEIEALTDKEELTPLGRVLSRLPVSPTMSKMIVLGVIFRCLDPMITLATMANHADLFIRTPEVRSKAHDKQREAYEGQNQSDHLATLEAFKEMRLLKGLQGEKAMIQRAADNFIHLGTFRNTEATGRQIEKMLAECQLVPREEIQFSMRDNALGGKRLNVNSDNTELIKCLLLAGLKPNVAVKRLPRRGPFRTLNENSVRLYNGSFNREKEDLTHPSGTLLCYTTLSHSNNSLHMRESTVVKPLIAALFGGNLEMNEHGRLVMDGWVPFRFDWHDQKHASKLVLEYRKALDKVLLVAFDALSGSGHSAARDLTEDPICEGFVRSVIEILSTSSDDSAAPNSA